MNEYETTLYNPAFSHIYIEERAYSYPLTHRVLQYFANLPHTEIPIKHYKDIFNRSHQSFHQQKESPSLILAVKEGNTVYKGAPVCQSFGHEHFFYTSCMMNCIYDCEYCYLQGMYPSACVVVFVNIEDIFTSVKSLLQQHPVYLCISYDTDLLAMEQVLGICHQWMDFVDSEPDLTVELRTKSANLNAVLDHKPCNRFLFAWTLSPETIAKQYEHRAPSLSLRLKSIQQAIANGYPVRLCFDPMLYTKDWKANYSKLIEQVADIIFFESLVDISLGVFRISADYMDKMRKQRPDSLIVNYPYENDHGVFHISNQRSKEMIQYMQGLLSNYIPKEKIFIWEETT